jgi:hypothetical protein
VRSEQFAFHDFGEAKNGVDRRAQLMAYRGEETGFGEICGLGAAAGQIAVCLGLFELGDQLVFFGLERQRFQILCFNCLQFPSMRFQSIAGSFR